MMLIINNVIYDYLFLILYQLDKIVKFGIYLNVHMSQNNSVLKLVKNNNQNFVIFILQK